MIAEYYSILPKLSSFDIMTAFVKTIGGWIECAPGESMAVEVQVSILSKLGLVAGIWMKSEQVVELKKREYNEPKYLYVQRLQ